MSHPYGRFPGERNCARRNKHGNENTSSESEDSNTEHHSAPRIRQGRHPPWLKGKEIGLFYKNKAKQEAKQAENNEQIIKLAPNVQERIENVLKRSEQYYNSLHNSEAYRDDINNMQQNKYDHIHDSDFKGKFLTMISGNIQENLAKAVCIASELQRDSNKDHTLLSEFKKTETSHEYKKMLEFRTTLPCYQKRSEILQLINKHQVVVISGETGSGKTTQIPQFILDEQIEAGNGSITKIICTEPRRISAISIAERVAAERAERLGRSVGFQVRLESVLPRNKGSIVYCTTGILLQHLQSDPALKNYSHIILDEIHERSTQSDFVLALLKFIIPKRPDLKVILMSATLNSEAFSKYYNDCPIIHIPGFTFPVQEFYLEDVLALTRFKFAEPPLHNSKKHDEFYEFIQPYIIKLLSEKTYPTHVIRELRNPNSEKLSLELIEQLIRYICVSKGPGAILVFLPGIMDITNLQKMMMSSLRYPADQYVIYPLHSRLPTFNQKSIFNKLCSIRKIIIATSIAETSITIEDVVYVIDCGRTKFAKFDTDKNLRTLQLEWISIANAKQRRGRAGRLRPGICYHMYSKAREVTLDEYPLPEMLRTRLEEVILQIKVLQLGKAKSFLQSVMNPPNRKAIDLSLDLLRTLHALDDDENLTPLGYHLAQLPVDPRTGKMIIWAALFSCVEPVFAIAASLSFKDAFICPVENEYEAKKKKRELSEYEFSDHIALAKALSRFEDEYRWKSAKHFCKNYFLSFNTLKLLSKMKTQFAQQLYEMKFLNSPNPGHSSANRNSNNRNLVKMIVCAGSYPNVAVVRRAAKGEYWTPEDGQVFVHPSSVNDKVNPRSPYLTYFMKQKSTAIYLHDTTCVSVPILVFAAPYLSIKPKNRNCIIDLPTSLSFPCDLRTAQLIQELQKQFNNLLGYKIAHPGTVSWDSFEGDLLNAIIGLVCETNMSVGFSRTN